MNEEVENYEMKKLQMQSVMGTKNYKNKKLTKDTTRKTNHKKCKPKFNPRLETQKHKART